MNRVKALLDWAEGSSGRGTGEILDFLEQETTNFGTYLASLIATYEKWWDLYPLTEAISARQATFTFEQSAQTEERSKEDPTKKETVLLPQLLQGIIDYAESEPVLLVGSPGMGKSTTLLQLLIVLSNQEIQKSEPRIPVLIRLKDYQLALSSPEDISGILSLIKEALEPELILGISEIKTLLFQNKRLFLFLDGLNEIPADIARNKLTNFRDQCKRAKIPLICTTRNLGDNFGIQRKVELQFLSPKEIRRFLSECMPGQEQQVLKLLNRGNQELGKTPFVLWMLYDVSRKSGQIPENLGEAFSRFTKNYTNHKINHEGIPYSQETIQNWNLSLEYLAFQMLKSPDPQDPGLIIAERYAANILTQFLSENSINLVQAEALLNNLLKYHLLQKSHKGEVSFCHQLIQEYYAAEYLLRLLPDLLKDENKLKRDYLNLLKWTEAIALMLAMVPDEDQASRVVKLAINDVDLLLGSRLAGSVNPTLQSETIGWINALEIPIRLKVDCWTASHSEAAISGLLTALKDPDPVIHREAVKGLGQIRSEAAIDRLFGVLEDPNFYVRKLAASALKQPNSEMAIPDWFIDLEVDDSWERLRQLPIPSLLDALDDSNHLVRWRAADVLIEVGREEAIPGLLNALEHHRDSNVRWRVAKALGKIGSKAAIPGLLNALKAKSPFVRESVVEALGQLGSEAAISYLLNVLKEDPSPNVRRFAAQSLGQLGSEAAIPGLLNALKDPKLDSN